MTASSALRRFAAAALLGAVAFAPAPASAGEICLLPWLDCAPSVTGSIGGEGWNEAAFYAGAGDGASVPVPALPEPAFEPEIEPEVVETPVADVPPYEPPSYDIDCQRGCEDD